MDHHKVAQDLLRDEGIRLKPYTDSVGKTTIGIGRNLDDKGITHAEAAALLHNDIEDALGAALRIIPGFNNLPEDAQHVVVNMIFQLGARGFQGFRRLIGAIHSHAWNAAAHEVLNSKAARQCPERFRRHADTLSALAKKT